MTNKIEKGLSFEEIIDALDKRVMFKQESGIFKYRESDLLEVWNEANLQKDSEISSLKSRIEELEKENQELKETIKEMKRNPFNR